MSRSSSRLRFQDLFLQLPMALVEPTRPKQYRISEGSRRAGKVRLQINTLCEGVPIPERSMLHCLARFFAFKRSQNWTGFKSWTTSPPSRASVIGFARSSEESGRPTPRRNHNRSREPRNRHDNVAPQPARLFVTHRRNHCATTCDGGKAVSGMPKRDLPD